MKSKLIFVCILLLLAGCSANSIGEIKDETFVGEKVVVKGEVVNSIKLGDISGFVIEDETGDIRVSSDSVPSEGENVKVEGTLMKDSLIGYYIMRDEQ